MSLVLNYTAYSDRGLIWQNNEGFTCADSCLLTLTDSMGDHAAGEITSQLMIAAVSRLDNDQPGPDLLESLRSACTEGNNSIADETKQNPSIQGMGTTLATLLLDGTYLGMRHVGDPRGYLLRDGEFIRITRGDTYVQSLVDEGGLAEEEVAIHSQRSLILKILTGHPVEPTLSYHDVHGDDCYLLCSDGPSDPVSMGTIRDALSERTPDEAATKLINYALKFGGPGNITVVAADIVDSSARTPYEPALVGVLQSVEEELPHPNTATGRAVTLRPRKSQEIVVASAPEKKASKGKRLVVSVALVLVAGLVGLGVWDWQKKESMYHLVVVDGQVQLMCDVSGSLLGSDLQELHQFICLTDDNEVQLPPAGAPRDKADCHIMTPEDFSPAVRNSLEGLPASSYDGVSDRIGHLTESVLSVCLSVSGDDRDTTSVDRKDGKLSLEPGVNYKQVRK